MKSILHGTVDGISKSIEKFNYEGRYMTNLVTWNMQGSNARNDIKWRTGVANLLSRTADIVCLQECGPPPSSAVHSWQHPANSQLHLYHWGTARTRIYIVFFNWDLIGNRVNLAIATRVPIVPGNIHQPLVPAAGAVHRPAIGVNVGGLNYYSMHSISPGGADTAGLLTAINAATPASAFVGGDFNRPPGGAVGGMDVCPPQKNTHSTRSARPANRFDYMYTNCILGLGCVGTVVESIIASDHFPVVFNF